MTNYYTKCSNPKGLEHNFKLQTMKDYITAQWARETSKAVLGEKVQKQINTCLESIELAVKRNQNYCDVGIYADPLTIQELNKRGFETKVVDGYDPRESGYLNIKW
jgi:hypothetical protein